MSDQQKLELTGKISHVGPLETVGKNNLEKRLFVIETEGNYPQQIAFECFKDNAHKVKDADKGCRVRVSFDVRGREYQGRYYTNLTAWKVSFMGRDESAPEQTSPSAEMPDENMPF